MGVPVVATPFAASGLSLDHGKHLLLANTESQFAESILHLLASKSLRMELSSNGATWVDRMYSWTVVADALMGAYRDVAMQRNCVPGRY
jgi:glycosyltransferase involved in cell wall biosynthesis